MSSHETDKDVTIPVHDDAREDEQTLIKRIFSALTTSFNPKKNLIATFKRPDNQLKPLDGIRSLGFLWVLLIHSWKALAVGIDPKDVDLQAKLEESHYVNWSAFSRLADKGGYGVDMFFVLSGFLISFILIKERQKNISANDTSTRRVGINIPRFYVRRALRIIPVYWLAIGFATLIGLLLFSKDSFIYESSMNCAYKFWHNVLFLNNVLGTYNTMCLVPSWSIAVEVQMYVISPLIIYLMCLKKILAFIVPFVMIVASCLINLVLAILYDCSSEVAFESDVCKTVLYEKVYTKWSPYLFGMMAAYIYVNYFENKSDQALSERANFYRKISLYCTYGAACVATIIVILVNYDFNNPAFVRWMDYAVARPLFGLITAFVLLNCLVGNLKIINSILSLYVFYPIGQLSYSGYLFQFFVIVFNYSYVINIGWFGVGHGSLFVLNLFNTITTLLICIPIHIFIERPIMNLRW
ncbi:hypothetical protein AKO1_009037 [Acrasis kona]|uniref:Acyltransferase 3 domain-containing protein n=1 Tax=Acrasis kona TaxID=1008807 RepID=A0AAW2ZIJ9_9EUKA